MAKVDVSKWKPFVVGDLFDIHPTKAYKMKNAQLMDGGDNPVVVNSSYNNGIGGYSTQEVTEKGGMVTFSDTTTADTIFYQPDDFVGYPHVQGMYPKGEYAEKWGERQLLFFVVTFRKAAVIRGFDYSYKFTREIASGMEVLLPVDEFGEPDWVYMDKYMSAVMKESKASLRSLRQADGERHVIDTSRWREFTIGGLFEISRPVARSQAKYEDGNVPFVASGNYNNGVTKWCEPKCDEVLDVGNCITVSPLDGSAFYQAESFLGRGGAGSAILILRNASLTELSGLFVASVIRRSLTKYTYSDQLNSKTIEGENICLPVDASGEPDWNYMDDYMRTVMENVKSGLSAMQAIG